VLGDPCYDQIVAARHGRDRFRKSLGVGQRRLVVVSSTWGPGSLRKTSPDLLPRLGRELPRRDYLVIAVLHPNIWHGEGPAEVLRCLAEARRAGVRLVAPTSGWQRVMIAADVLIGDHGSVPRYGALVDVPILLGAYPGHLVAPGTPGEQLAAIAPRLVANRPLQSQLEKARGSHEPGRYAAVARRLSSEPGSFAQHTRRLFYQLLELPEPPTAPRIAPIRQAHLL
jgi:hypothetical protein